jgi:hypothetical protein
MAKGAGLTGSVQRAVANAGSFTAERINPAVANRIAA